ncbi:MAG TPA: zf-HC2 domain-containing protein [Streptosporangiaceae bacterium]|nr:zf-HC2 domain-containing protein [Streptosporangiaceae bacterium]
MTGLTDCGDIRYALGVYVVGAIDPAERATVDAHLSHCPECREELAGLAGLPALLGRVPREDAERLAFGAEELEEPPAEMLDSLLAQVTSRRRARRWRVVAAAAAAAVIAVGGGIIGGALMTHSHSTREGGNAYISHLARGTDTRTDVTAAVYYQPKGAGTSMQVQVTGIRNGTHCVFWVINSSDQHLRAGSWTVNGTKDGNWYSASSSTPVSGVHGFDITGARGQVLVKIPVNLNGQSQRTGASGR